MSIAVSVIDWKSANVETRGEFSFSKERIAELSAALSASSSGCILLSTCNRCELYVSGGSGDPYLLLCGAMGLDAARYSEIFRTYSGDDAIRRLFSVACGLESQILGEGQILTQLKDAATSARDVGCSDGTLQTLFRLAITAGKESRTRVKLEGVPPSIVDAAILRAETHFGGLAGKSAVVIGNGAVGRQCAELLRDHGCSVTVTLRSYKHGETVVPSGCVTVAYDDRYSAIDGADLVFSATSSPHLTISAEQYAQLRRKPSFIADLAVPLDVDRQLASALTLININDFDGDGSARQTLNADNLAEICAIMEKYVREYYRWETRRNRSVEPPRFPLFIDLRGRKCVVVGGGAVGARRAAALRDYGAEVTIVDPAATERLNEAHYRARAFDPHDLDGAFLAVAATDDRAVNREIARLCGERGVFVSVADAIDECTFWFPALSSNERLSVGLVSRSGDHRYVASAARRVRSLMEEL